MTFDMHDIKLLLDELRMAISRGYIPKTTEKNHPPNKVNGTDFPPATLPAAWVTAPRISSRKRKVSRGMP